MSLSPGTVIAERYALQEPLGEGGMATIWSATHLLTHKAVALKFLKGPADEDQIRRFVREAQAASAVRHPNVIGIHDILTLDDGSPAMVMDLLEGESLATKLKRSGALSVQELADIMVPVLSAVGAAHAAGIVHRDLKPDNIFLADRGGGRAEPMVLDFGICKLTPELATTISNMTTTGSLVGTPLYMAPEQLFGERDVDARADVWSIGVILYECAVGRKPFEAENLGQLIRRVTSGPDVPLVELAPELPSNLIDLIGRMLDPDRTRRPADLRDAFAVLSGFTPITAQGFTSARMPALLPTRRPNARRSQTGAIIGAAALAALAGAVALRGVGSGKAAENLAVPAPSGSASSTLAVPVIEPDSRHEPKPAPSTAPGPPAVAPVSELAARPSASAEPPPPRPRPRSMTGSKLKPSADPSQPKADSSQPKTDSKLSGGVHGEVPF